MSSTHAPTKVLSFTAGQIPSTHNKDDVAVCTYNIACLGKLWGTKKNFCHRDDLHLHVNKPLKPKPLELKRERFWVANKSSSCSCFEIPPKYAKEERSHSHERAILSRVYEQHLLFPYRSWDGHRNRRLYHVMCLCFSRSLWRRSPFNFSLSIFLFFLVNEWRALAAKITSREKMQSEQRRRRRSWA